MSGFVDHVEGAVFGNTDFGVGIVRVDPFGVAGAAAIAFFIKLADGFGVVGIDACGGGEAFDVFPLLGLGVAVDEFAQGGVGFDDAGTDAGVTGLEQAVAAQASEDKLGVGLVDFLGDPTADDQGAGVVGSVMIELIAQEGAQREIGGAAAGDGAFAGKVCEEADHKHLEIDGGIDAGASAV